MNLSDGGGRILSNLPGLGFLAATVAGALLLVGGAAAIFFDFGNYREALAKDLTLFATLTGLGIAQIALAFFGERPGPIRRVAVIARSCLVGLVGLAVLLAVVFVIVGPMH